MVLVRKNGKSYNAGVITQEHPTLFSNSMLANTWPAMDVDDWARHYVLADSVSK